MSRHIPINIERKIIAESMGRCMNPSCREELIKINGDIIEKAHIVAFCDTQENTYENLVVLCPNCHTNFDKNSAYTEEEVRSWKETRKKEFEEFFKYKYDSFDDLVKKIKPILLENQMIYDSYYNDTNKALWDAFEEKVLSNNSMIKSVLSSNLNLIQRHDEDDYSNLSLVMKYLVHIDEFESTRADKEKTRQVLFPRDINSLFGIKPVEDYRLPSVESLEILISKLIENEVFHSVELGIEKPFIKFIENNVITTVYLDDLPRLRQLYYDYNCIRKAKVRLDSLNYALKIIRSRNLSFQYSNLPSVREIKINRKKLVFVYEYCLTNVQLRLLTPDMFTVIVNLHNWNRELCISSEAYELAKEMSVTLLRTDELYGYLRKIS